MITIIYKKKKKKNKTNKNDRNNKRKEKLEKKWKRTFHIKKVAKLKKSKSRLVSQFNKMQLPIKSPEQEFVIECIKNDNNVIVDSVAGSGKTTCNLHIANEFPHYNILLLTYNSKLKLETREKVSKLQIRNLETQSYHSFCVKHYDNKCYTDSTIHTILSTDQVLYDVIDYDIIIIDEAQDISKLYYQLICKIYKDNGKCAKICIVGDKFQSIFQFNGADERFIIFGEDLFHFNELLWKKCTLSTSFRITAEMSSFINKCMLQQDRIL